jgi:hypothetical protein
VKKGPVLLTSTSLVQGGEDRTMEIILVGQINVRFNSDKCISVTSPTNRYQTHTSCQQQISTGASMLQ